MPINYAALTFGWSLIVFQVQRGNFFLIPTFYRQLFVPIFEDYTVFVPTLIKMKTSICSPQVAKTLKVSRLSQTQEITASSLTKRTHQPVIFSLSAGK